MASTVATPMFTYSAWLKGESVYTGKSERFVMGFPVADFQRRFKWTEEQCVKLIENIWLEHSIGSYMINVLEGLEGHQYDGIILDGQQRLMAIQKYISNEFPVKNINGELVFWNDLPLVSQRRFKNAHFPSIEVRVTDRAELVEIYNTFNYGGTPHTEEDRAI